MSCERCGKEMRNCDKIDDGWIDWCDCQCSCGFCLKCREKEMGIR